MSTDTFQAPSPDYLAELLPQYGIESFIAQGGMGAVYKARQISLDRDVAIKVLPKELGSDAEFRESFITEAKAMARLNHPNLLGVYDYGDVDGMPYIVMEYVEGGSLHQAAWNQAIEPASAVAIVKGICDGLAHAHEHGIIHRDVKPSNILLTIKAEPKVADFGLAHSIDAEESGMMMGTPGYTAPEVFQDPSQAGELADIYSLGVILHQLLTGIDPAGSAGPPTKATGNLRLDALWRKATNINPSQRYESMAAMASDLDKWLGIAKRVAVVSTGTPAYNPPKSTTQTIRSGGGLGIFPKLLIIASLSAAVFYAYGRLKESKQILKENIASGKAVNALPAKEIVIHTGPPAAVPEVDSTDSEDPVEVIIPDDREDGADGLIADKVEVEDKETAEDYTPGDPQLLERAVALITAARGIRDKAFAENARALLFQIGTSARTLKAEEIESIELLKKDIVNNRIPLTDEVEGLPEKLSRDFESARSKEAVICKAYETEIKRIHDSYVSRLLAAAKEEKDEDKKRNLQEQAERAGNQEMWVTSLAPEPEWVSRSSSVTFIRTSDFVGKWLYSSEIEASRWIAHRDGTLEIIGRSLTGTWEIRRNGSVEVTLRHVNPYVFKREGEGWKGETPTGIPTQLTPGLW